MSCLWVMGGSRRGTSDPRRRAVYQDWLATSDRAEEAIDAGRASNAAFAVLRADLVAFRTKFAEAQESNGARIRIVQSQLSALGPPPDADMGEAEPMDLADLRARLDTQLDELRVPVVVAQEAFTRATGLIDEIDRIVRGRKTEELLSRGSSPLNPAIWGGAFRELGRAVDNLFSETTSNWQLARERQQLQSSLPEVALFGVVGLLFLLRGRHWAGALVTRLRRLGGRGTGVWSFVASLLRIVLPFTGLLLILIAVSISNTLGLRGELLIRSVPIWGATLLAALWLGERVYARNDEDALIPMPAQQRAAARRNFVSIAIILVIYQMLGLIEEVENFSEADRAVIGFFPLLAASVLLYRMRRISLKSLKDQGEEEGGALQRSGLR